MDEPHTLPVHSLHASREPRLHLARAVTRSSLRRSPLSKPLLQLAERLGQSEKERSVRLDDQNNHAMRDLSFTHSLPVTIIPTEDCVEGMVACLEDETDASNLSCPLDSVLHTGRILVRSRDHAFCIPKDQMKTVTQPVQDPEARRTWGLFMQRHIREAERSEDPVLQSLLHLVRSQSQQQVSYSPSRRDAPLSLQKQGLSKDLVRRRLEEARRAEDAGRGLLSISTGEAFERVRDDKEVEELERDIASTTASVASSLSTLLTNSTWITQLTGAQDELFDGLTPEAWSDFQQKRQRLSAIDHTIEKDGLQYKTVVNLFEKVMKSVPRIYSNKKSGWFVIDLDPVLMTSHLLSFSEEYDVFSGDVDDLDDIVESVDGDVDGDGEEMGLGGGETPPVPAESDDDDSYSNNFVSDGESSQDEGETVPAEPSTVDSFTNSWHKMTSPSFLSVTYDEVHLIERLNTVKNFVETCDTQEKRTALTRSVEIQTMFSLEGMTVDKEKELHARVLSQALFRYCALLLLLKPERKLNYLNTVITWRNQLLAYKETPYFGPGRAALALSFLMSKPAENVEALLDFINEDVIDVPVKYTFDEYDEENDDDITKEKKDSEKEEEEDKEDSEKKPKVKLHKLYLKLALNGLLNKLVRVRDTDSSRVVRNLYLLPMTFLRWIAAVLPHPSVISLPPRFRYVVDNVIQWYQFHEAAMKRRFPGIAEWFRQEILYLWKRPDVLRKLKRWEGESGGFQPEHKVMVIAPSHLAQSIQEYGILPLMDFRNTHWLRTLSVALWLGLLWSKFRSDPKERVEALSVGVAASALLGDSGTITSSDLDIRPILQLEMLLQKEGEEAADQITNVLDSVVRMDKEVTFEKLLPEYNSIKEDRGKRQVLYDILTSYETAFRNGKGFESSHRLANTILLNAGELGASRVPTFPSLGLSFNMITKQHVFSSGGMLLSGYLDTSVFSNILSSRLLHTYLLEWADHVSYREVLEKDLSPIVYHAQVLWYVTYLLLAVLHKLRTDAESDASTEAYLRVIFLLYKSGMRSYHAMLNMTTTTMFGSLVLGSPMTCFALSDAYDLLTKDYKETVSNINDVNPLPYPLSTTQSRLQTVLEYTYLLGTICTMHAKDEVSTESKESEEGKTGSYSDIPMTSKDTLLFHTSLQGTVLCLTSGKEEKEWVPGLVHNLYESTFPPSGTRSGIMPLQPSHLTKKLIVSLKYRSEKDLGSSTDKWTYPNMYAYLPPLPYIKQFFIKLKKDFGTDGKNHPINQVPSAEQKNLLSIMYAYYTQSLLTLPKQYTSFQAMAEERKESLSTLWQALSHVYINVKSEYLPNRPYSEMEHHKAPSSTEELFSVVERQLEGVSAEEESKVLLQCWALSQLKESKKVNLSELNTLGKANLVSWLPKLPVESPEDKLGKVLVNKTFT